MIALADREKTITDDDLLADHREPRGSSPAGNAGVAPPR